MLPVETAFKTYTGLDGKPLDNGYVYFGQANQNPITTPVTVYWDAAGTQPAAQPLRTVNGYIMRAGTPANVFYEGAYSELVKDSKDRQVFYSCTSDDFSIATVVSNFISNLAASAGASLIGFIQAGVGAIKRTVQDKLRDNISVFDFMTPAQIADVRAGTLLVDVTVPIQTAIDYMRTLTASRASGIVDITSPYFVQTSALHFPPGQYLVTAPLWFGINSALPGWNASKIVENVIGPGAVIVGRTAGKPVLDLSGAFGMKISGLTVFGSGTASPNVGILLARSGNAAGDNPSAGAHRFTNVNVHGDFTLACVYNYASEINIWNSCYFYQNSGKTVYLGTNNNARHAVVSQNCTIATTVQSAYGDFFETCIVKSSTGNTTASGAVFYIESMDFGPSVMNSYIDTSGAVYMPSFFFRNAQGLTSANTTSYDQGVRIIGNTFEYRTIQDIIAVDVDHQVIDLTIEGNSMPIDMSTGNRAHLAVSGGGGAVKNLRAQPTDGGTLGDPFITLGAGEVYGKDLGVVAMRTLVVGTDWSYTEATLSKNGTFYPIDLAPLGVPKTAKFIAVKVMAKTSAAAADNTMHLRGFGVAASAQNFAVTPAVNNIEMYAEGLVPVVGGQIQYSVPANFTAARILFREYHL